MKHINQRFEVRLPFKKKLVSCQVGGQNDCHSGGPKLFFFIYLFIFC